MKKIILILLALPLFAFGQTILSVEQDVPLFLPEGWSMFGFSCYESINVIDAFEPIADKVLLVKDYTGNAYLPEWSFNAIGDLESNRGYQIKTSQVITDFQFCPFIVPIVEGCIDLTAFNYNSLANSDDGSCTDIVEGCINSLAFNYNELANTDDNSCITMVYGCTDSVADNFSAEANTDDESCIYYGCTDPQTCNYNEFANTDDGSCVYAEVGFDCEGNLFVIGCTDELASNYDSLAIVDNNECEYLNYFSIPDTGFLAYLQDNYPQVIENGLLNIQEASNIESLSIWSSAYNINNVNGIEYFSNLQSLWMGTNTLTTFNFSGLNINSIYLAEPFLIDVQITDSNINELGIGTDGLCFFGFCDLLNLNLEGSIISYLMLGGYDYCGFECEAAITSINYPESVESIMISSSSGIDIETLITEYPNLSSLFISGFDSLTSLPDLSGLSNLSSLTISGFDSLTSLPDLLGLSNLSSLSIRYNNALTSLPDLSGLSNLSSLSIQSNDALTSLPDLSGLSNLTYLYISNNNALTSIPDLSGLSNLSYLSLSNNNAIECVSGYPEQLPINSNWPPVCPAACPYDIFLEYSSTTIIYDEDLCLTLIVNGCMDELAFNYDNLANVDDESCDYIYGCMDQTATNYNEDAVMEDESCEYIYGCIDPEADNYNTTATTDDESCIYYGCIDPTAGNYDEGANTDDGTCLIGGCMNATAENYNAEAVINDNTCIIYGCTVSIFPNYNSVATDADGSCDMNSLDVYGCTDESSWVYNSNVTIENGTCSLEVQIGIHAHGGIVIYIDETGEHGLVVAMEDLGSYQWGCYGTSIDGADGQGIGSGLQNTLDIVSGCNETNTAAYQSLNATTNGYTDWYLPSKEALALMSYLLYDCENYFDYWSSLEYNNNEALYVESGGAGCGIPYSVSKNNSLRVRAVRAF